MGDDDEVGLPQKGLNMIIKDVLPEVRIANESRELLNHCCVEFVKHVAREAQRISSDDQRKTIYHEHVQKALSNLGFPPDYVEAADRVLDECKEAREKKLKRKNSRLDKCGIPEDQLYMMQMELIEKARQEQQQAELSKMQEAGLVPMPGFVGQCPSTLQQSVANTPSSSTAVLAVASAPSTNADDEDYDV
uniref:Protein Dr1 n=1 Tax=Steinernema glaseri TaxID=37863 RepID=A0A1I7ZXA3_9BILA